METIIIFIAYFFSSAKMFKRKPLNVKFDVDCLPFYTSPVFGCATVCSYGSDSFPKILLCFFCVFSSLIRGCVGCNLRLLFWISLLSTGIKSYSLSPWSTFFSHKSNNLRTLRIIILFYKHYHHITCPVSACRNKRHKEPM